MNELIFSKIFDDGRFSIHMAHGDKYLPLCAQYYDKGDGTALQDVINISSAPVVSVSWPEGGTPSYKYHNAWEDISEMQDTVGAVSFLWQQSFKYWCMVDLRRPTNVWTLKSRIWTPKGDKEGSADVKEGDVLIVLDGEVLMNGGQHTAFSTYEVTEDEVIAFRATVDSVVVAVRPTSV